MIPTRGTLCSNLWVKLLPQSPPASPARTRTMLSALFVDPQPSQTCCKSPMRPLAQTPRHPARVGGGEGGAKVAQRGKLKSVTTNSWADELAAYCCSSADAPTGAASSSSDVVIELGTAAAVEQDSQTRMPAAITQRLYAAPACSGHQPCQLLAAAVGAEGRVGPASVDAPSTRVAPASDQSAAPTPVPAPAACSDPDSDQAQALDSDPAVEVNPDANI